MQSCHAALCADPCTFLLQHFCLHCGFVCAAVVELRSVVELGQNCAEGMKSCSLSTCDNIPVRYRLHRFAGCPGRRMSDTIAGATASGKLGLGSVVWGGAAQVSVGNTFAFGAGLQGCSRGGGSNELFSLQCHNLCYSVYVLDRVSCNCLCCRRCCY